MLVELEHEDGPVAHDLLGKRQQEAVRTTREVGQVDDIHDVALRCLLQRGQDLLAVAPEGVLVALAQAAQLGLDEIHGQHGAPHVRDLLRQAQIGACVVHVVGTPDEQDEIFLLGLGLGDQLGALGVAAVLEAGVRLQARAPGLLDLPGRHAKRRG